MANLSRIVLAAVLVVVFILCLVESKNVNHKKAAIQKKIQKHKRTVTPGYELVTVASSPQTTVCEGFACDVDGCINSNLVCDGEYDCSDGSDEADCATTNEVVIQTAYFIRNKSTNKCLEVSGDPGVHNANQVQIGDCEFTKDDTDQIWHFDDRNRLYSVISGRCLDLDGLRNRADGVKAQIYECLRNDDQRWELQYYGATKYFRLYNLDTGKCLDIIGWSSTANSAKAQEWSCEDYNTPNTDQYWYLLEAPADDYTFLTNRATGKCLDANGLPGVANRVNVQSWDCEWDLLTTDQIWRVDGSHLINKRSRRCLDLHGNNIDIYDCEDNDAMNWQFVYHPGTQYFQIKNIRSGLCLDVVGYASRGNGANLQQNHCEAFSDYKSDHWWIKVPPPSWNRGGSAALF